MIDFLFEPFTLKRCEDFYTFLYSSFPKLGVIWQIEVPKVSGATKIKIAIWKKHALDLEYIYIYNPRFLNSYPLWLTVYISGGKMEHEILGPFAAPKSRHRPSRYGTCIPWGKRLHNYGKSPFFMGNSYKWQFSIAMLVYQRDPKGISECVFSIQK